LPGLAVVCLLLLLLQPCQASRQGAWKYDPLKVETCGIFWNISTNSQFTWFIKKSPHILSV
jgi:hypothetical protein